MFRMKFNNGGQYVIFRKYYLRDYELVGSFDTLEQTTRYIVDHKIPGKYIVAWQIWRLEVEKDDNQIK